MTEAEWLAGTNPTPMLHFLGGKASARKLRLFAVACCMRVLPAFEHWDIVDSLKQVEAVADQLLDPTALIAVAQRVESHLYPEMPPEQALVCQAASAAAYFDESADGTAAFGVDDPEASAFPAAMRCLVTVSPESKEWCEYSKYIRCIFGNPFRPVEFSPAWRTETAFTLARQMYESRDFSAMPILADALQDAGCDNEDILSHCRGLGPHVRGCWVVDLVLGKE